MKKIQRQHIRPSNRETNNNPARRVLAAVVLRAYYDLCSQNQECRQKAIEFFDDEGIAMAAAFGGIPGWKVRQKLTEVIGD